MQIHRLEKWVVTGILVLSSATCLANPQVEPTPLRQAFRNPPLKYATRPLWFWNNTEVTEQGILEQMQAALPHPLKRWPAA